MSDEHIDFFEKYRTAHFKPLGFFLQIQSQALCRVDSFVFQISVKYRYVLYSTLCRDI